MTPSFDLKHTRLMGLPPFDLPQFKKKDKRPSIDELLHCEKPMTVCIAMMAVETETRYPAIVFITDRQFTVSNVLKFETGVSKFCHIQDYTGQYNAGVLISAGDITLSYEIVREVIDNIETRCHSGENVKVTDIANSLYNECKKRNGENEFKLKFNAQFIVFGIDRLPQGISRHISIITKNLEDPYLSNKSCDTEGYAIIGSGYWAAFFELVRCKCVTTPCKCSYHPYMDLPEVIFRVYRAKKEGERAEGVGEGTDLGILQLADGATKIGFKSLNTSKIYEVLDNEINDIKKFEGILIKKGAPDIDAILENTPIHQFKITK